VYYPVQTIEQTGAIYFNWLALLDTNVAVIFCLMLCVASFTLVSSLFILVLDNVPAIGILRSVGASRSLIRSIFVDLGMRIVLRGMIIGNVLGLGLLLIQKYTHIVPLDPEAYYLNCVPVEIRPWGFIALNVGVAVASWLVLWIPARTASSVDPAKTINFE
ncbi:MAG: ABC transporter permease, partial [Muribaculaceae bacterium]|nr:ABC transporter permease [Muribaculaceae bacterium]